MNAPASRRSDLRDLVRRDRTRASYRNRYAITIAADPHTAKDLNTPHVIGSSHGDVKEQMPGVWAGG